MESVVRGWHQRSTGTRAALRYLGAACAFTSQAIHLWLLPGELLLSILPGLFFFAVAVGQGLLGVSLLFQPGKRVLRLGILLNVAVVSTLIAMHLITLPNITGAHHHSTGVLELTAGVSEVVLITVLALLLAERG